MGDTVWTVMPAIAIVTCVVLAPPPASQEGIASHAAAWHRVSGGDWALVVTVEPAPGWHVYWENPGDSGSAPRIELTLPRGWEAGEIRFPRPDVAMHDDEVLYGYESRVQYVVPVRRNPVASGAASEPADVPSAPAPWSMRARVMACKERCVMAELTASGESAAAVGPELPPGIAGGTIGGRSLPDTAERAGVAARRIDGRFVIEGPAHGHASARFIPADVPGMEVTLPLGQPAVGGTLADGRFRIEVPCGAPGADPAGPAFGGLVLLGNRPADPCVRLVVPHRPNAPREAGESATPRGAN